MANTDALRSSLDNYEVDRKAGRDRAYMESVLRRIEAPQRKIVHVETQQESKTAAPVARRPAAEATHAPADDTPAFSRVKPLAHPAKEEAEPTHDARAARKAAKKSMKSGMVLELDINMDSARETPEVEFKEVAFKEVQKDDTDVLWTDLTEGEDPAAKPDPKAGYMKGNYALFRRELDSEHAAYFFSTELVDDAEQARVPQGYEVRLTEETNLPYIARRGKGDHLNQTEMVRAKSLDHAIGIASTKGIAGLHGE